MNRKVLDAVAILLSISTAVYVLSCAKTAEAQTPSGTLRTWHKITLTFNGPDTNEDATPNPFMDYRLNVTFTKGNQSFKVPGYYAADGNAGNSGAASGNKWRVHFAPPDTGTWSWTASFRTGTNVAVQTDADAGSATHFNGASGSFNVQITNKSGRDMRGKGRLQYVGGHYLRFAETGEYFLKQGPDAPENFLAYQDFDGPFKSDGVDDGHVKTWSPHVSDWKSGDPTWKNDKGKGLIGAINYLESEGMNAFSFLTMNIAGDDKNVFPYTNYNERKRIDCSRMDQWEMVFEHGTKRGFFLHFKTMETENERLLDGGVIDDSGKGTKQSGAGLGDERKLYYRELIARFGHHPALNWNLGEEINDSSTSIKASWAQYFYDNDPYRHHVVIHNGSNHYDLLGSASKLTGFSLQTTETDFHRVHDQIKNYLKRSVNAGKPWAVACDEPGDPTWAIRDDSNKKNSHEDGRKNALWGTFCGGGWGNEWYFGYRNKHDDLSLEDFRSRSEWWDYCRYALDFWTNNNLPITDMVNNNALTEDGVSLKDVDGDDLASSYCFYKDGDTYVCYFKAGGNMQLNLSGVSGLFSVKWFNPRTGGSLIDGGTINGGGWRNLGSPPNTPNEDWAVLVRGDGVPANMKVTRFILINAETDEDIEEINEGDEFNLNDIGNKLNIRAEVEGAVESVIFDLNGVNKTENDPPYAYAGDSGDDYGIWTPSVGDYTVIGTPYAGDNGTGDKGDAKTVNFSFIDEVPPLDPKIMTGEISASSSWKTVTLPDSYSNMVVTATIVNTQSNPPLVTRVRNASGNNFEVRVQRFDGQSGSVSGVTLYWMAMEAGTFSAAEAGAKIEARKLISTITDEKDSWVGQALPYNQSYSSPVVLGQVMSFNDSKPSVFWNRGASVSEPASSSQLFVGKTVCEDTTVSRANETLGVIILEAGTGNLKTKEGDIPYEAKLGADTIKGISKDKTYGLTLNATRALVNQSAMDGGNGGWAVLKQVLNPGTNTLTLAIDEDTIGDSERNHTTEQVGYLALGATSNQEPFVAGINLNGPSVTIDGETWMSMSEAQSNGLTLGEHSTGTTNVSPINGGEAASMLKSFVNRGNANLSLSYPLEDGDYDISFYSMHYQSNLEVRFDVIAEGVTLETDTGFQKSDPLGTWEKFGPYNVTVSGGELNFTLGSFVIGNDNADPQLMGLVIEQK